MKDVQLDPAMQWHSMMGTKGGMAPGGNLIGAHGKTSRPCRQLPPLLLAHTLVHISDLRQQACAAALEKVPLASQGITCPAP